MTQYTQEQLSAIAHVLYSVLDAVVAMNVIRDLHQSDEGSEILRLIVRDNLEDCGPFISDTLSVG